MFSKIKANFTQTKNKEKRSPQTQWVQMRSCGLVFMSTWCSAAGHEYITSALLFRPTCTINKWPLKLWGNLLFSPLALWTIWAYIAVGMMGWGRSCKYLRRPSHRTGSSRWSKSADGGSEMQNGTKTHAWTHFSKVRFNYSTDSSGPTDSYAHT